MKKFLAISALLIFGVISVAVSSFAQRETENYWADFNLGSWVLYEVTGGIQQKHTLIKKTNTEITLKAEAIMGGQVASSTEVKIPLTAASRTAADSQVEVNESGDKVEVKNITLDCKAYVVKGQEGVSKTWICDEVPGGIVKVVSGNNIVMTLKDFEAK